MSSTSCSLYSHLLNQYPSKILSVGRFHLNFQVQHWFSLAWTELPCPYRLMTVVRQPFPTISPFLSGNHSFSPFELYFHNVLVWVAKTLTSGSLGIPQTTQCTDIAPALAQLLTWSSTRCPSVFCWSFLSVLLARDLTSTSESKQLTCLENQSFW